MVIGYLARGILPEWFYLWPDSYRVPLQAAANDWLDQLLRRTVVFATWRIGNTAPFI